MAATAIAGPVCEKCGNDGRAAGFVAMVARLETATEYDDRTNDDGMSGDDAVSSLSALIELARGILPVQ